MIQNSKKLKSKISCDYTGKIRRNNERDTDSLLEYADTIKESSTKSRLLKTHRLYISYFLYVTRLLFMFVDILKLVKKKIKISFRLE